MDFFYCNIFSHAPEKNVYKNMIGWNIFLKPITTKEKWASQTHHTVGKTKRIFCNVMSSFFTKIKTIRSTFSKFSKFHETLPFSTSKSHEWHVENKELLFWIIFSDVWSYFSCRSFFEIIVLCSRKSPFSKKNSCHFLKHLYG